MLSVPGGYSEGPQFVRTGTQEEITRLRFRFHNGYSTKTWISANGNASNRCGKHGCTLRFRNCGSAETHCLNSRIRNVYAVTETLIAIVFPRLVNPTDTQLSARFLKSKCNDKSRIHKVYAVTETLKAVVSTICKFDRHTIIRWIFRRVHHSLGSSSWDRKGFDFSCKSQICLIKKDIVGNTLLMWMHS